MASLDVSTSSEEPAQVMVGFEGRNYLLCTLRKPDLLQCALDLNFEVGDELSLAANGKCHVHLTGYLIEDPDELLEDDDDDEDEEETVEKEVKKKNKRNKEEVANGPPVKKLKANTKNAQAEDSDDDSDEDDSDVGVKYLLQKTLESDEDDDTFVSDTEDNGEEEDVGEEVNSDVDEEEEDDEDESSLSEADSDDELATPNPTAKLNGSPKKQEIITPTKQKERKDKKNEQKKQQTKEVKTPNKENKSPKAKEAKKAVLQNGLIIEDIKEGQGPPAKPGKFISVYYEGRLKSNNKVFDATNKGAGFSFRLGGGEVIKGWDAGLVGMKLGGKRRLTCPPNMAYGPKGSPPTIPANSTLVFEVELKKIR